jgi:hypothetical protein
VYYIDTSVTASGVITVSTTSAVTIWGVGATRTTTPYSGITINCTLPGTQLTLSDIWIASPYSGGNVINFTGAGNTLSVPDNEAAILESNGYNNLANVHVGKTNSTELTINGPNGTNTANDPVGLFLYKSSGSAAIGGDVNEAAGTITFASGNIFVKGSQTGAVIGGDDATGSVTNGDITISGGQLSIEVNARGAGIGASNQGECAGNVYVTGGTTLINVDWTGSAIGRGDSGKTVGNLYVSGGTLEVYVDPNAASSWQVPAGPSNVPITANIFYGGIGSTTAGNVAAVDLSLFYGSTPQQVTASFTPAGGSATQLYSAVGFNQYDYYTTVPTPPPTPSYTPDNWINNPNNKTLFLYLPTSPVTGTIDVTIAGNRTQFVYSYDATTGTFRVTPATSYSFSVNAPTGTSFFYTNTGASATAPISIPLGASIYLTVVPPSGAEVASVTATNASVTPVGNGIYTISNPTANGAITVTTDTTSAAYQASFAFSPTDTAYVTVGSVVADVVTIASGDSLTFNVTPVTGYGIGAVTASNGTVTPNSDGSYTLSNVTAATTVTINATTTTNTVTFSGSNAVATVNGVIATTATVPTGGNLFFKVAPYLGYTVSSVTVGSTVLRPDANGYYLLQNVSANTTVTITTAVDLGSWLNYADDSWYTVPNTYTLTTAAQFAGLIELVNGGNNLAGSTINLGASLDLGAYSWVPIGGGQIVNDNTPATGTPSFAGVFNGNGYTLSNLNIAPSAFADGLGGIGLFGYTNGATIQNVNLTSGSIAIPSQANGVAGIVGIAQDTSITGSLNNVSVTVTGNLTRDTAGVAGAVINTTGTPVDNVTNCANTAPITGKGRLGGVVGAVYAGVTGGVVIDQCFNTGAIKASGDSGTRTYVGGLVGYCEGVINNSYNQGTLSADQGAYYAGGVVGILTGATGFPTASMTDCYNTGLVTNQSSGNTEALWGYDDGTSNVTVTNCVYTDNNTQDKLAATIVNVSAISDADMRSSVALSSTRLDSTEFVQYGANYPVLSWQVVPFTGTTQADFNTALASLDAVHCAISVSAAVPINTTTTTINLASINGGVTRASGYTGALFNVTSGGTLVVNSGGIGSTAALVGINVNGGTFTLTPTGALGITEINYLTTNADVINIGDSIANIAGTLLIQSGVVADELVVAQGVNYNLSDPDAEACAYAGGGYDILYDPEANTLYLSAAR